MRVTTTICLIGFFAPLAVAQSDGDILSREPVHFPEFKDAPSIQMYYDVDAYNSALSDQAATMERLTYYSDGLKVVAFLCQPTLLQAGKRYPVIVFNRGSTTRNDISTVHMPLFKKLVNSGFLVIAPALRGSEGGEGKDQVGGDDLNDILNIVQLLKGLSNVDMSNLFLLGESRGGIMTYLALKQGFPAKAAVTIGAITDMETFVKDYPREEAFFQSLYPDYHNRRSEILMNRSAISWSDKLNIPILIMCGQADVVVKPSHALNLAKLLSDQKKVFQLIVLEGGNHILSKKSAEERDRQTIEWFRKYMH